MKGIIFGGCSFTWGQGLYFYSDLENLTYPAGENVFNGEDLKLSHIKFRETLYYPRLVANHFNTFETFKNANGGSEDETFQFFKFVFEEKNRIADHISYEKYNHHDFDYMVIQLSQMWRNRFYYDKNDPNKFINVPLHTLSELEKRYPDFLEWFYNSDETFDDCNETMLEQQFLRLKNEVMFYEEKGIKVRILSWQNELVSPILKDPYLSERFIKLKYRNKEHKTIESLQREHKNMVIKSDFDNFVGNPPLDHHPSKLCHQVIAENIINNIQKDLK
jgi:hypothetical protein